MSFLTHQLGLTPAPRPAEMTRTAVALATVALVGTTFMALLFVPEFVGRSRDLKAQSRARQVMSCLNQGGQWENAGPTGGQCVTRGAN